MALCIDISVLSIVAVAVGLHSQFLLEKYNRYSVPDKRPIDGMCLWKVPRLWLNAIVLVFFPGSQGSITCLVMMEFVVNKAECYRGLAYFVSLFRFINTLHHPLISSVVPS